MLSTLVRITIQISPDVHGTWSEYFTVTGDTIRDIERQTKELETVYKEKHGEDRVITQVGLRI